MLAAKLIAPIRIITVLCCLISNAPAFAQQAGAPKCNAPANMSALSGVWVDKSAIIAAKHGAHRTQHFYHLEFKQDGSATGIKSWRKYESDGFHGFDVNGNKVYEDSEGVVGVFERSDCSLVLVETTLEAGIFHGTLLDDGRIRFTFAQAGEADSMVVRGWLSRETK